CLARKQTRHSFPTILLKKKHVVFNRFKRLKEPIKTFLTDKGREFTSARFNILCEESGFEHIEVEVDLITRNKTWKLVDRSAGVKHTWVCDTKMEACNTTHIGVKHTGMCDTKMEVCNIIHVPMETRLKISM